MEEQRKNSYDPNEDIVDRMWKRSKNSINLVIVVCNILVFLAVTLTGGTESSRHMMDCGAAYAPLIESGEYYRLFTSMFLHFGIQHLINNMLLLLFLGDYLERAAGKIRYLVIYLGGGLVGNLCSYLHELSLMKTGEAPAVSAGASGAGVFQSDRGAEAGTGNDAGTSEGAGERGFAGVQRSSGLAKPSGSRSPVERKKLC